MILGGVLAIGRGWVGTTPPQALVGRRGSYEFPFWCSKFSPVKMVESTSQQREPPMVHHKEKTSLSQRQRRKRGRCCSSQLRARLAFGAILSSKLWRAYYRLSYLLSLLADSLVEDNLLPDVGLHHLFEVQDAPLVEVIHFGLQGKANHSATLPDPVCLLLVHFPFVAHPLALLHFGKRTLLSIIHHLFIYLLFICLPVLSVCLSVCLSIYIYIYRYLSTYHPSSIYLSIIYLSAGLVWSGLVWSGLVDDVWEVGEESLVQGKGVQHKEQVVLGLLSKHLPHHLVGLARVGDGVVEGIEAVGWVHLEGLADSLESVAQFLELFAEAPNVLPGQLRSYAGQLQDAVIHLLAEGLEGVHSVLHILQVLVLSWDLEGQEETSPHHLILLRPAFPHLPLLIVPAVEEVLEALVLRERGVAGHPPLALLDEVLAEAPRGLLLRQVGHRDDGELVQQAVVQPVEVFVAPVHRRVAVAGCQPVGDVALDALELGLFGGLFHGAEERVRVGSPLWAFGAHVY
ncbi:hypothetical protein E2320_013283, partial [Naja naja]